MAAPLSFSGKSSATLDDAGNLYGSTVGAIGGSGIYFNKTPWQDKAIYGGVFVIGLIAWLKLRKK